jgi:PadR family transcriptional regulator, regulatory protein PadR
MEQEVRLLRRFLLTDNRTSAILLLTVNRIFRGGDTVPANHDKRDVLQGTLDLLVLKTLETMGAMHGWGIARRLEQVSENLLQMNQGTVYPALLRLEQAGWIGSTWAVTENNRRARFYSLTPAGRRRLRVEERNWDRMSAVIARVLRPEA